MKTRKKESAARVDIEPGADVTGASNWSELLGDIKRVARKGGVWTFHANGRFTVFAGSCLSEYIWFMEGGALKFRNPVL